MKYREEIIEGQISTWRRARQMVLDNPHNAVPQATCYETEITVLPSGDYMEKSVATHAYALTDTTVEIPVIDPETYEPTAQTFTAGEFQLMAASVALWMMRGSNNA